MKINRELLKERVVYSICLLYIILFVYAAVNKLLDFENFRVQLGQSPLLSAFAGWVAWVVPVIELMIVGLLAFSRYRLWGLWSAFCLMAMFTAYIFIMLSFSPFVPCSCGGILEKLGWTEHLVFNVVFIILAAAGILILAGMAASSSKKPAALARNFGILIVGSTSCMALLFVLSEDMIHHRNNFIRRFTPSVATLRHEYELANNSYYLGMYGGNPIPTKQDKFVPANVIQINEDGTEETLTNFYTKKPDANAVTDFTKELRAIAIKVFQGGKKIEKPNLVEVLISFSITERRFKEVDIDNLTKCVLDALNTIAFEDDSQVCSLIANKHVHPTKQNALLIGITKLTEERKGFQDDIKLYSLKAQDTAI